MHFDQLSYLLIKYIVLQIGRMVRLSTHGMSQDSVILPSPMLLHAVRSGVTIPKG